MRLRRTLALLTASFVSTALVVGGAAPALADLAPPGVGAVEDVDGAPLLTWPSVDGAGGYAVQVAVDMSDAASSLVAQGTTAVPAWVPTTATATADGAALYWRVAAQSGPTGTTGRGAWSDWQTLERPALATPVPVAPADGAEVRYPEPATFRWEPVPGAVSYTLEHSSDDTFPAGSVTTSTTTTATAFTPSAPLAREAGGAPITWSWRVRANFAPASGTTTRPGPWAVARSFQVTWSAERSAPTPLRPLGGRLHSDLLFEWSPVDGASAYRLVVGKSAPGGVVVADVVDVTTTATAYVPTGTLPDTGYYWQVTALDIADVPGAPSEVVAFTKQWNATAEASATGVAKAYPVPLTGSADIGAPEEVSLSDLELAWEPVARATLYAVELYALDGAPVLTCRTASTSVTVVGRVGSGRTDPDRLKASSTCLWSSAADRRVRAGVDYRWRVQAVDYAGDQTTALGAANPVGTLVSQWSDDVVGPRYLRVTEPRTSTAGSVDVDVAAWEAEWATQESAPPAPVMAWEPMDGVNAYEVEVYTDVSMTTHVATLYTPSTRVRPTGVFGDSTSDAYYWRVRGIVFDDGWSTYTFPEPQPWSPVATWRKTSTPVDFDVATPVRTTTDGTVVLSWRPQSASAPLDGGSRGYQVTVVNSSGTTVGTQKVEHPFFVAHVPSATPASRRPLGPGSYTATVAALDANGNPGTRSAPLPFTVATPAPDGLTAAPASGSVRLSWDAGAAAARYVVRYWSTATPGTVKVVPGTGTLREREVVVPDLAPGTYAWQVESLDTNANRSATQNPAPTFTVAAATPALTTATGTVLAGASTPLRWQAVPGASRYAVRVATTSAGLTATSAATETVATAHVPTGALVYGQTYSWQVVAYGELASGATRLTLGTSPVRTFTVTTAPSGATLTSAKATGTSVALTWPDLSVTPSKRGSAEAPRYTVQYGVAGTTGQVDEWGPTVDVSPGVLSTTVAGLEHSTTYGFRVRAWNSVGTSAWSPVKTAATATVPGVVRSLRATQGASSLAMSWSSPSSDGGSPVTSYAVRWHVGDADWSARTVTSTSTTLTGLTPLATYEVQVQAVNAIGTGAAASVTSAVVATPAAPTSVTAARGDRSAKVAWAGVPAAANGGSAVTGYVVQTRAYSATKKTWSTWATKATLTASARSTTVTGMTNGTLYEVRVAAKNAIGTGTTSTAVRVTPATKPAAPTSVRAASTTGRTTVTWARPTTNGATITGYVVQYSSNRTTWRTMSKRTASSTSATWTGGTKGRTYYFRVYATSDLGSSPVSSTVSAVRH